MSKRQLLCLMGVWVIIFLFLGVPSLWHKIISVVSGLIIIFISYNLPHENKSDSQSPHSAFTENNNHSSNI